MPASLRIADVLEKALEPYPDCDAAKIIDDILRFFEQRLDPLLQSMGYPYDAVAAVTGFVRTEPVSTIRARVEALVELKKESDYELFLQLMKRVNNIAPKEAVHAVAAKRLVQEEEKALWAAFSSVKDSIVQSVSEKRYSDAMAAVRTLAAPINTFFDKVLVMDKDEAVRHNRLALIKHIQTTAFSIADFSKLV